MTENADFLSKLKDGWDVASKLAGKGVGEVSGMFSKRDDSSRQSSGVYWYRGTWNAASGLNPEVDFFEPQTGVGFASSMMQRFTVSKGERLFIQACSELISVETEQAINNLRTAVQVDTQLTDAYFLLGCMLLEFGDSAEAGSCFQKALLCQQGLGSKIKKYLPSFKLLLPLSPWSAIALFPDLLGVNLLLAMSWRRSGNVSMAVSVMEQIMSIMPDVPLAKFFMGLLRLELGQYNETINLLNGLVVDSTIGAANLLVLGEAYQRCGNLPAMLEEYTKALMRSDIDRVIRYDLLMAQEKVKEAMGSGNAGQVKAQIMAECAQYVPFFERLGIKSGSKAGCVPSMPASAPGAPASVQVPTVGVGQVSAAPAAMAGQVPTSPAVVPGQAPVVSGTAPIQAAPTAPPTVATSATAPAPQNAGTAQNPYGGFTDRLNVGAGVSGATVSQPTAPQSNSEFNYQNLQVSCGALGKVYPLASYTILSIGRESGDIVLNFDSSVSHSHARIFRATNNHFYLEDLNSTNGSYLNGARIAAGNTYELKRGDNFKIGQTTFNVI